PGVGGQPPQGGWVGGGHPPPASLLQEVKRHDGTFEIAGSVPDIRPYFSQARVYVAPLQLGRGVQNKILEAMAMQVPVVASPRAVEGLEVQPGEHVLVAGTESQFATAVVDLWRNAARRRCLVEAAFRLIQARYRWQPNLELLDACLPAAGGAPVLEARLAACAI
ncbi:MAG: glycosyltransferase, partial [Candidatus Binatia bacterium]